MTRPPSDLRAFRAHGGKLFVWHGWADGAIMATSSIGYYEGVMKFMGSRKQTEDFFRLFLVPGVHHGGGGHGLTEFEYVQRYGNLGGKRRGTRNADRQPAFLGRVVELGERFIPGKLRRVCLKVIVGVPYLFFLAYNFVSRNIARGDSTHLTLRSVDQVGTCRPSIPFRFAEG